LERNIPSLDCLQVERKDRDRRKGVEERDGKDDYGSKKPNKSGKSGNRGGPGGKKGDRRGLGVADSQSIQETTGGRKQIRTGTTCLERGVSGMGERNGEGGKRRQ